MSKQCKLALSLLILLSMKAFGSMPQVIRHANGFSVIESKREVKVNDYDVEKSLKLMGQHQLQSFLANGGKIRAAKLDNGDYVLRSFVPGKGGGGILAAATCIVGMTLSGIAGAGAAIGVTIVTLNPVAGAAAGVATATAGVGATGYATAAASVLPTP